ncbi:hypothetical protein [Actinocorallia libanotica]|uniref:Uncharacterized protein n=1 Tax=Actinocorallia libanotica TaxID=46162 RepID=A0ABP4CI12_9ACTN
MVEVRASINDGAWTGAYATAKPPQDEPDDELLSCSVQAPVDRRRPLFILNVPAAAAVATASIGRDRFTFVTPDGDQITGRGWASLLPPRTNMESRVQVEGEGEAFEDLVAVWQTAQIPAR